MGTTHRSSGKAKASLYLGLLCLLLGILTLFSQFYPFLILIILAAVSALILALRSKRQIRASGGELVGSGFATSGVILSVAGVVVGFLLMPFT